MNDVACANREALINMAWMDGHSSIDPANLDFQFFLFPNETND